MREKGFKSKCGMTLVEVMVSTMIILIAVIGIMYSYVKVIEMNSIGRDAGVAMRGLKDKIEEVKGSVFKDIPAVYNNSKFTINGLNGMGVIYVSSVLAPDASISTHVWQVKGAYCWKLTGGRLIGEDKNLNGILDAGEDTNGNGQIDSYVQIDTQIYG